MDTNESGVNTLLTVLSELLVVSYLGCYFRILPKTNFLSYLRE